MARLLANHLRLGAPAATSRGLDTADMTEVGAIIADAVTDFDRKQAELCERVAAICQKHPLYE